MLLWGEGMREEEGVSAAPPPLLLNSADPGALDTSLLQKEKDLEPPGPTKPAVSIP